MLSFEEREIRKGQLGASEVHKIFNFDTQELQDLWELKVGIQDYKDISSEAITAGNILEEDCLCYYSNVNNVKLALNERIEHKTIKNFVVSLDAREVESSIPVENKVINEKTWNSWIAKRSSNAVYNEIKLNIPKNYYAQVQAQIDVLDVDYGILNVNTLTDYEQADPINVKITDLHNKQVKILKNEAFIQEMEKRIIYFLNCVKYKRRPSEIDYLERQLFNV